VTITVIRSASPSAQGILAIPCNLLLVFRPSNSTKFLPVTTTMLPILIGLVSEDYTNVLLLSKDSFEIGGMLLED
jgi:hypothetical protein